MPLFLFNKKSKEERFWNWVVKNKSKLERFINSEHQDFRVYNALTKELKKYNPLLFPEMTTTNSNEIVLILTPDGMPEGVIPVQNLYNTKPQLDNWVIKKFRQATDKIELNFDGLEYPSSDIEVVPKIDKEQEKINIKLHIRNMNSDAKKHKALAFLYLDHIIGEYNTITKIGQIDFYQLKKDQTVENSITLLELRKLIERELYKAY